MKTILSIAAFVVAAGAAHTQTLWYGGDFDGTNGLSAELNSTFVSDSWVFDDFNVGPGGATITGLFGNYLTNGSSNAARYEIRQGVSLGNGGTLLASGSLDSLTWTNTGNSGFGYDLQKLSGSINPLNLAEGTYFMALSVEGANDRMFIATTGGANGVGSPLGNNNSFFRSATFGNDYSNASDVTFVGDFSYGVTTGRDTQAVPEPFTMGLLGMGALAARRKLKSQAK